MTDTNLVERRGIYIASKAKHGDRWKAFRDAGHPIISTWIDECGEGQTADFHDLWQRCVTEAAQAAVTIVYHEEGETLKGALLEAGAALSHGRRIIVVGDPPGTWVKHRNVSRTATIEQAFDEAADALSRTPGGDGLGLETTAEELRALNGMLDLVNEQAIDGVGYYWGGEFVRAREEISSAMVALKQAFPSLLRDHDRLTAEVERLRAKEKAEADLAAANAARKTMLPLSDDGKYVWFDGHGPVELDFDEELRNRAEAAEARLADAEKALKDIREWIDARSWTHNFACDRAFEIIDAALIAAERDNRTPETKP